MNETFQTTVRFGDNYVIPIVGKGDVKIQTKTNTTETISNVFYVPNLKSNLLSVGQLQEKGYTITIAAGTCQIRDVKKQLIAQVPMIVEYPCSKQKSYTGYSECDAGRSLEW